MKSLERNTKKISIAYYKGIQKQTLNNETYEVEVWDTPFEYNMTVFIPTGDIIVELFGTLEKYDLIANLTTKSLKINEKTKFWINTLPNTALNNNDYIVKNIKSSINTVSIGLVKKVIGNVKDFWISNNDEIPTKIRISMETGSNNSLIIYVDNNDNIDINKDTLIWYNKDYAEDLSDSNYSFSTETIGVDITKIVLLPIVEE